MTPSPTHPSRRSPRLHSYDYAQAGAYFVTICTEGRTNRFGQIQDGIMLLTPLGELVAGTWSGLEERFEVEVDAFVMMPNHLHGVLVLAGSGRFLSCPPGRLTTNADRSMTDGQALSLSEVVRRFKTYTANQARRIGDKDHGVTDGVLWQRNFYERIIRNERERDAIRKYIADNPLQWHLDRENPDR
jgi:putative transposase